MRSFTVARGSDGRLSAWGNNELHQCDLPRLAPGTVASQLRVGDFGAFAIVGAGAVETFGPGCAGSAGVTRLQPLALPRLGQVMSLRALPLPQSAALLAVGFDNVNSVLGPLPLDLSSWGLTNCMLRVRPDASTLLVGSGGTATFALAVPAASSLAGLLVHFQAVVLDPACGNAAGLVMSDAVTAVVGP